MSPLETFSSSVASRVQRDGWIEVVVPLVAPLLTELINRCFDSSAALQEFAAGKVTFSQMVELRRRANALARSIETRPMRVQRAGAAITSAIMEELRAAAARDHGDNDPWAEAFMEATRYAD